MSKDEKEAIAKLDRIVQYLTEERTKEPYHSAREFFWWDNYNGAVDFIRIARMEVGS